MLLKSQKIGDLFTLPKVPLPSTFRNSKFSNVWGLKVGLIGIKIFEKLKTRINLETWNAQPIT